MLRFFAVHLPDRLQRGIGEAHVGVNDARIFIRPMDSA